MASLGSSTPAQAGPWSVRGGTAERGEALLGLLEREPESESGLRTLIKTLGLVRARQLARRHATRQRRWAPSFIAGRLELAANGRVSALAAFRRALAQAGTQPAAAKLLGWIGEELVASGHVKEAERLLARWIKKRPKDAGAVQILARSALSRRDLKLACKYQGQLAALRPKNARIKAIHARLLEQTGHLTPAAKAYEAALKLVSGDPALRCQLLRERGRLLESLERFDEAVASYKAAMKLTQKGGYIHRELQASILGSYRRRGELSKLVDEARAMLKAQPKSTLALGTLARQLARNPRKLDEAAGFYERYLKVAPNDVKARAAQMFLLLRLGRGSEAVPHAAKLAALQPGQPRRLLEYAGLLSQLGRSKEAKKALIDGIAIYRKAKHGDGLQLVARALDALGDRVAAGKAFEAMLALDKRGYRYHRIYGDYLWGRARRDEALEIWARMLGTKPSVLAYAAWVESIERAQAWLYPSVRAKVLTTVEQGLRRYPRDAGLRTLSRRFHAP